MLPFANASTTLVGIISMKNPTASCCFAAEVYVESDFVSSVAGSIFIPAPGCRTLTTTSPIMRAMVETISK